MDTTPSTAHPGSSKGRPNYPTDFKLRLAQQACEPGVSVPRLACKHGIKANLLLIGAAITAPGCSAAYRQHRCWCR